MFTLFVQVLVSLCLSTIIGVLFSSWLNKRHRRRELEYQDSLFEIIPPCAVSHSDLDVIEPDDNEVRVSKILR